MTTTAVDTDAAYPHERGTCPRCGSGLVRHLLIGLRVSDDPSVPEPDWVESVGCVHPGYDRACDACGNTWETTWSDDDDDG